MNFFLIFFILYSGGDFNSFFNNEQKLDFKTRSLAYRAAEHFLKKREKFVGRSLAIDHIEKETFFWGVKKKGFVIIEASDYTRLNKNDLVVYKSQNKFYYAKLKKRIKKGWIGQSFDRENNNHTLINEKNFLGTVFEKKLYSY